MEKFIKNERKPYEYCLDFEYGNSAYEALNPIERYLAHKSTGVKIDKDKQNLSNAEKFCLNSLKHTVIFPIVMALTECAYP